MIQKVVKRDGTSQEFDSIKIANAIKKAMDSVSEIEEPSWRTATIIANKLSKLEQETIQVEELQNLVEDALIRSSAKEAAKAYIRFRHQRNIQRKAARYAKFDEISSASQSDMTRENANMNADTPAGQISKYASVSTKEYALDELLDPTIAQMHQNGDIHIHDLDYYATKSLTCVQHPLDHVFKGFTAQHAQARSPKRIETAAILACISFQTAQNEMHGGQAIPAFDFYMAPFIKRTFNEEIDKACDLFGIIDRGENAWMYNSPDEYVYKELDGIDSARERSYQHAINQTVRRTYQAMESFIHNLNTMHSRGGNQVVFSSINYGTDTSAEGRCVMRELLKATLAGVGNDQTALFPIQIWKVKEGVNYNPEDKNYDLYELACEVASKRYFPNFINLDATYNQDENWNATDPLRYMHEVATMGCRTRVFENRFGPKTSIGRGNLSFTTINLPRLGILSMNEFPDDETKRVEYFFELLKDRCDIVAKQLSDRFNFQKTAFKRQFPFLMNYLWIDGDKLKDDDYAESVINQGTLGIGFIGLAECLIALTGKHHGESMEAQQLGIKIVSYMRSLANEYSEQYQHNYSVLGTPAEGLAGRFTKIDKKKFGVIPGITSKDFYTNSSHVPVYYHITPSHKAAVECPYHEIERAGHIFYVEMDSVVGNPKAVMRVVDMARAYNGGYISINYNSNTCLSCGHTWIGRDQVCPICGSDHVSTLQRITGYLVGSTDKWNDGKLAELKARVEHK